VQLKQYGNLKNTFNIFTDTMTTADGV